MDYKKLLTGLLSKAYKMDEGRISEILKDDSDETSVLADLLTEDRERVSKLKPKDEGEGQSKFQEGYKKAKKEERESFEKELKEHYGIESDLKGQDLVEHIVTTKAAEGSKKKGEPVTEDEIKASPVYRALEKKYKTDIEQKETDWKTKLEEAEKGFQQKETFGSFKSEALKVLDGLKPILPKDAKVARNHRETFANSFQGLEIRKEEDGGFVVLRDGKVVTDDHGNSLDWKDLVKTKASDFFEFQENNGGSNAGNSNDDKTKGGNTGGNTKKGYPEGVQKPKDFGEYSKLVQDRNISLEDRKAISEAWKAETARTE